MNSDKFYEAKFNEIKKHIGETVGDCAEKECAERISKIFGPHMTLCAALTSVGMVLGGCNDRHELYKDLISKSESLFKEFTKAVFDSIKASSQKENYSGD